jgi:hypothetical protein
MTVAQGRLRIWILAGALVVAVGLIAVVVPHVANDDGARTRPTTERDEASRPTTGSCASVVRGRPAQISLTGVPCWVAVGVYANYQAQIEEQAEARSAPHRRHAAWLAIFVGRPHERVGAWRCVTFSYAGYPLLAECKSPNRHFTIRGTARSAGPYFGRGQSKSTRPDPLGAIRPERYFASKSKWRRYSRPIQLDTARSFIKHTPAACRGVSPEAMVNSMATGWLADGSPPAGHAYHAMVDYCYEAST